MVYSKWALRMWDKGKHRMRPVLLMHSTGDTQMPYRSFERLKQAAPGQLVSA